MAAALMVTGQVAEVVVLAQVAAAQRLQMMEGAAELIMSAEVVQLNEATAAALAGEEEHQDQQQAARVSQIAEGYRSHSKGALKRVFH